VKTEHISVEGILSPAVFAIPSAIEKRDELLASARSVTAVVDQESANTAVIALKTLKEFSRTIEASRKEAKAPIDLIVASIQNIAKELTQSIVAETERLDRMVGAYNEKQRLEAEKKRQEAIAEEQRIAAEAQKKLDEAAAAGASDRKLEKIEQKAEEQLAMAKAETAAIAAPKFAGIANRYTWEYEVTSIEALYAAYPLMVKLTPIDSMIKAALNNGATLPGVTARKVPRTSVR